LISDLQAYLPSSLGRETKAEELSLYTWQIHCSISGASLTLCAWFFLLMFDGGFFVCLGFFAGFC